MEVWLPVARWNGKFQMVGNGGWGGQVSYGPMRAALNAGYATASTDTGHKGEGDGAQFALGHPEKLVDFSYRAVHETAVAAKAFIAAFYGRAQTYSYFNGCSTGGRQGLMAAQRNPQDFDGIIAGAPAINLTRLTRGVSQWKRASCAARRASCRNRNCGLSTEPPWLPAMRSTAWPTTCSPIQGNAALTPRRYCAEEPSRPTA